MTTNNFKFVVKNGLVVNGTFTANSTVVNAAAINATSIGLTSNVSVGADVSLNTSAVKVGLTTINSTSLQVGNSTSNLTFSSSNLAINGVNVNTMITSNAATAYTNAIAIAANATNLTTGTVAVARLPTSSTTQAGVVQLIDSTACTSVVLAATANSVKTVYDYAASIAASGGTPPSGANTNIQYNNSGAFGGSAALTFNNTTNTVTVGSQVQVGANVIANTTAVTVGNSTVNVITTSSQVAVGANVALTAANMKVGNTTVNSTINSSSINVTTAASSVTVNSSAAAIGSNVALSTTGLIVGNSTVNAEVTSTNLKVISATSNVTILNNQISIGAATINSTVYSGSANNANNLGGVAAASYVNTSGTYTITGVHTYQVNVVVGNTTVNTQLSNAAIRLANSTAASVLDLTSLRLGTGTTNVVISNTVSSFGGNVSVTGTANIAGNVTVGSSGFIVGNGNFITTVNATNITTGTLVTDRLPATANITTAVNVGANVNLTTSTINTGNSTVNSSISATQIFTDGALIVESTSRLNSDLMVHGNTVITPTINATGFTYGAQSYNISQSTTTYGLFFKPDGTRFYTSSRGTTRIYTYNVTDPWTLSGSSYVSNSSISLQTTEPRGIYIKPDGLKAYVVSAISPTTVFQYSLNEAWGNSFTYDTVSLNISTTSDVNATSAGAQDIAFSPDGKYFFVTTDINSAATVHRYELATAWDITTAAYSGNSFLTEGYQNSPTGITFTDSGVMMFVLGNQLDKIDTFRLSTPWSLASVQYIGFSTVNVSSTSGEGRPTALYFKPDTSKVYLAGLDLTTVYDYNVPVANTYITGNSQLGSLTVAGRTDTAEANVSTRLSVGTNVVITPLQIRVGNSTVNATINSTVYSGTSNNALFLGGASAASYQTTAGLLANVATLSANNASFLGGVAAASYTNTSGAYTITGVRTHSANVIVNANLGIGTSTPGTRFEIRNDGNNSHALVLSHNANTGTSAFSGLKAICGGGTAQFWVTGSGTTTAALGTDTATPLVLFSNSVNRVVIAANGDIDFATTPTVAGSPLSIPVYTGSTAENTDFPIGTTLLIDSGDALYTMNSSRTIYYTVNGGASPFAVATNYRDYITGSSRSSLTGTWRLRGSIVNASTGGGDEPPTPGTPYYISLYQRVA